MATDTMAVKKKYERIPMNGKMTSGAGARKNPHVE